MSGASPISWTDATWNPTRGCSRVSAGCVNCYAERQAVRHAASGRPYAGLVRSTPAGPRWTGRVDLVTHALGWPLKWGGAPAARAEGRSSRIFVDSMSDLFHENLEDAEIGAVFGIMAAAPQHTFQILTKRPERAAAWFHWLASRSLPPVLVCQTNARTIGAPNLPIAEETWPLPNVWIGTSVEDQATADERIPELLACPAAVRFVSYEPALGPVDFNALKCGTWKDEFTLYGSALTGQFSTTECSYDQRARLDWLIVGGESGPRARPFDLAWPRSARDQCRAAGVPLFVKQMGSHALEADPDPRRGRFGCSTGQAGEAPPYLMGKRPVTLRDRKGEDPSEWPEDLRVREFPRAAGAAA